MNLLTKTLPQCLKWQDPEFAEIFKHHKLNIVVDVLQKTITQSPNLHELFDLWFGLLTQEELEHALLSPKIWKFLIAQQQSEQFSDALKALIQFEISVLQQAAEPKKFIHHTSPSLQWNLLTNEARNTAGEIYKNPYKHLGFTVDLFSDLVRGEQRDIPWSDSGFTEVQCESAVSKITAALDFIERLSPPCFTIMQSSIHTIAVRFDSSRPRFNCASTNYVNGMVFIINPDLPEVSTETIVDALVHEMTHNLFDIAELYEPCVPTKFHPGTIRSPWTGRLLDPNTYVQACYTWYGLKNFWALAQQRMPSQNTALYLQQAQRGFAQIEHIHAVNLSGFTFDDKIIATLQSLQ